MIRDTGRAPGDMVKLDLAELDPPDHALAAGQDAIGQLAQEYQLVAFDEHQLIWLLGDAIGGPGC